MGETVGDVRHRAHQSPHFYPGRLCERGGLVGLFPTEAAVGAGGAAEVAVAGGLLVDGTLQAQVLDDATRGEREVLAHQFGDVILGDDGGVLSADGDADRVGDADGVGKLHFGAGGETRGDDVLGDVSAHVAGAAVDLDGVLAAERAAAVGAAAAVAVDDDLPAREAGVSMRAADDELAGGVDVEDDVVIPEFLRDARGG